MLRWRSILKLASNVWGIYCFRLKHPMVCRIKEEISPPRIISLPHGILKLFLWPYRIPGVILERGTNTVSGGHNPR